MKPLQIRSLRLFIRRMTDTAPSKHLSPRCLFLPAIHKTRSPALECDYNLHKSNSTYFTDMDMSRVNFTLVLFRNIFSFVPGPNHFTLVLGATSCTWHREIKPFQAYELWTRIISWDEKWLYVVTHFVQPGVFVPDEYAMQPSKRRAARDKKKDVDPKRAVFASSVARYVFKNNRKTEAPEQALRRAGLLPTGEAEMAEVEEQRIRGLAVGRLEAGWEKVRDLFEPGPVALGWYNSVY
jgi:thioesterase superfamily protein